MFRSSQHKQILDNLTKAVIMLDSALRILYMNPAAEMLFEATMRRLKGMRAEEWLAASPSELQVLQESLQSGHPYTKREARLVTMAGRELTVDYSVNTIHQSRGDRTLLVEVEARDRLMRIEREEELLARHAASRNLVRGLAHEIKNPLGGIRGAAQLLERELNDENLHEYTRVIIEEADRLRNLVDRLLGPRKLPQMSDVNIHAILERVCSLVSAESGGWLTVLRDYDPSIPEFTGDSEQLIQAVLNIVRNGVQALERAGTPHPTLQLRTRAMRQVTLGTERHRLVCCVMISDNGPGIPSEIFHNIFYPMVTGHADGTGLGLSIAQSIINQHQGLIECVTEPGETQFTLFIPLELHHENLG
jgi:two-component system nitrogen regulation sensor histidine kinase GlnL